MLVFGTKNKTTKRGSGTFYCPQCKKDCRYTRYEVSKKGHVFFVSVLDRGTVGEYVQCRKCGGQFDPAVLAVPDDGAIKKQLVMMYRGCVAVIAGCDREVSDEEVAVARRLNDTFSGEDMPEDVQRRDIAKADINELVAMLVQFREFLPEEAKAGILEDCIEVAAADGPVSKVERHYLGLIGTSLGVPKTHLDTMIQSSAS